MNPKPFRYPKALTSEHLMALRPGTDGDGFDMITVAKHNWCSKCPGVLDKGNERIVVPHSPECPNVQLSLALEAGASAMRFYEQCERAFGTSNTQVQTASAGDVQ